MKRPYLLALALLLLVRPFPAGADDADLQKGGDVVVNGHVLNGHHFYRKGGTMFFPLSVISGVLQRRVTFDLTGHNVSCDRHLYNFPDAFKINEMVYVSWRDLTRMMPDLRLSANHGRVLIEAGLYASSPRWYDQTGKPDDKKPDDKKPDDVKKGDDKKEGPTFENIAGHLDFDNQFVVDATLQNNTPNAMHRVFATLVVVDDNGLAVANQDHKYASFEQSLGTLEPGAAKTVTFQTGIRNPTDVDSEAHHLRIELAGLNLGTTTVDLSYHIDVNWDDK